MKRRSMPAHSTSWSMDDVFIMDHVEVMTLRELADELHRSIPYIHDRLNALNIKRTPIKRSVTKDYTQCKNIPCMAMLPAGKKFCSYLCELEYSNITIPTKAEITKKCIKGSKSFCDLAKEYEISNSFLISLLRSYDIKSSNQSLSIKNGTPKKQVSKAGTREDLGVFVRSSWEANVLRYLNYAGKRWEYEPKTFIFDEIARGTRSYTPDIKVYNKNGSYYWIEVKGYMRPQDKTKLKRFAKYYPKEFKKLKFLTKNDRVEATKAFKKLGVAKWRFYDDIEKRFSSKIDLWE